MSKKAPYSLIIYLTIFLIFSKWSFAAQEMFFGDFFRWLQTSQLYLEDGAEIVIESLQRTHPLGFEGSKIVEGIWIKKEYLPDGTVRFWVGEVSRGSERGFQSSKVLGVFYPKTGKVVIEATGKNVDTIGKAVKGLMHPPEETPAIRRGRLARLGNYFRGFFRGGGGPLPPGPIKLSGASLGTADYQALMETGRQIRINKLVEETIENNWTITQVNDGFRRDFLLRDDPWARLEMWKRLAEKDIPNGAYRQYYDGLINPPEPVRPPYEIRDAERRGLFGRPRY